MSTSLLPFLVTSSRHLKFAMVELLVNKQETTLSKCLTNVMRLYGSRGFLVRMVHADSEFEPTLAAASRAWVPA
jgi:hypothetical protein